MDNFAFNTRKSKTTNQCSLDRRILSSQNRLSMARITDTTIFWWSVLTWNSVFIILMNGQKQAVGKKFGLIFSNIIDNIGICPVLNLTQLIACLYLIIKILCCTCPRFKKGSIMIYIKLKNFWGTLPTA